MDVDDFFRSPANTAHKKYEAIRAFCFENRSAEDVAIQFGYTTATLYSLVRDFKIQLCSGRAEMQFFIATSAGRKPKHDHDALRQLIVLLRKKYLSVSDIKSILDTQHPSTSERHIYNVIHAEGFSRLPRRSQKLRENALAQAPLSAPKSAVLDYKIEAFVTQNAGLLCFLPYLKTFGIDQLIESSAYPSTQTLPRLQSILAFVGLKLANVRRYTADDLWCMDRGMGLFAGLNVLPKAAWFNSYSHRVTRDMNLSFLKSLHALWAKLGLLSDTANLDFVTIPYWGDDSHLENNWSGTRHQALTSILAAIAQDPDTGIITYGDTNVRHSNESHIVVEFLDFYTQGGDQGLKYLVFDSKFTTYENLSQLDDQGVKFITIRRRGKKIVDELAELPRSEWKKIRVHAADGKTRQLLVHDQSFFLKGYNKEIRQIAITGHGKIKPALIITNDFDLKKDRIVRKYARRWLVEKTISEQTHFFHLNKVSSSMVIKVDFDLTMTILAHNLYRLFAMDLEGYSHHSAQSLYEKFIRNAGKVEINDQEITVFLKKKRHLPAIITAMSQLPPVHLSWLGDRRLNIVAATYS